MREIERKGEKKREKERKGEKKMHWVNYYQSAFNLQKEKKTKYIGRNDRNFKKLLYLYIYNRPPSL